MICVFVGDFNRVPAVPKAFFAVSLVMVRLNSSEYRRIRGLNIEHPLDLQAFVNLATSADPAAMYVVSFCPQ